MAMLADPNPVQICPLALIAAEDVVKKPVSEVIDDFERGCSG